jgi:hypothetical protein
MPSQQDRLSSPIDISSRISTPQAISVSSDTSPARESDVLSFSHAADWPPMAANRHVAMGLSGLGSRAPSIPPARTSLASVSSIAYPFEFELGQLREQCAELQSENSELKGRLEMLQ